MPAGMIHGTFFVIKYDSTGEEEMGSSIWCTWRRKSSPAIATDSNGGVYITGEVTGELDNHTSARLVRHLFSQVR